MMIYDIARCIILGNFFKNIVIAVNLICITGERVVAAGDSAGANLLTAMTLKCISLGIKIPTGLLLLYAPTYINFMPSPARLLCVMDPLLPFGFLMRCLKGMFTFYKTKDFINIYFVLCSIYLSRSE